MLPEQLPPCLLCGERMYDSGGASISPLLVQEWFQCRSCDGRVLSLWKGTGYLIYFPDTAFTAQRQEKHLNPGLAAWVDDVVLVTLRDFEARREAAKRRAWLAFLPGFLERHNVMETEPGCIAYHQLPTQAAKDEIDEWERKSHDQPGFDSAPSLAQIPDLVWVYGHDGNKWRVQDKDASHRVPLPRDPITVENAEYWGSILAEVGITKYEETENRYSSDSSKIRPWFTFDVDDVEFVVGWRTRVVELVASSKRTIDFSSVEELGQRDNVTFGRNVDGEPSYVKIHAYTKVKCIEYLRAMLAAARMR